MSGAPFLRRSKHSIVQGRSSDSSRMRRLPGFHQWLGLPHPFMPSTGGTHSSGNCCRFTRHSLLIPREGETIAGTKIGFSRREANESGGIFVRRVRKSLKKPFRPRPAVFGRPPSIFGTHFAITSINCGTATAVRFLHLFKFGLVVLGGQPPGAAGNRDDSLLFFCVSRNAEPKRRRTGPETQQPSIAFIRAAQNRTGNEATVHRPP